MKIHAALKRLLVAILALASWGACAQNFLWRADSLTNHVWLFGTIHAGKTSWYPMPKAVDQAFEDSRTVVVEADVTDQKAMQKYAPAMTYAPPDNLREHLPPGDYERVLRILPRYGLQELQVAQMKPFMVASLLVLAEWTRLGYLPQLGVDTYFIDRAREEKKPLVELEGVALQAKLMDSLSDAQGVTLLDGTLDAIERGLTGEQIEGVVRAWEIGDPELMLRITREYDAKVKGAAEFEEKFVWSRHDAMLAKISAWLDTGSSPRFIAVGALHLVGPRGLVEQLRKRGYTVRQVFVAPQEEDGAGGEKP
ncbi:MAG TPA: TraB/GumN family protein [Usitatibacter sp.]|nr:TraB/GumN family protein [Usitatibacter sp.]